MILKSQVKIKNKSKHLSRLKTKSATSLMAGAVLAIMSTALHSHESLVYLDQGWNEAQRNAYYTTPQGSNLVSKRFYFALEQAGKRRLFSDPKNIRKYNYIFDESTNDSDDDDDDDDDRGELLPIGFAVEPQASGEDWIGYTCSACHTNEIRYDDYRIRLDGAPSLSDFNGFVTALSNAAKDTLDNNRKFQRFSERLDNSDYSAESDLRLELQAFSDSMSAFVARNDLADNSHYGRVDAFGIIMNELFVDDLGFPGNHNPANALVSYPALWDTPSHDYVQWNGSASNPIGRNVGEVLGTFGSVDLQNPSTLGNTSARAEELIAIERLLTTLKSPAWPQEILGEIDSEKAMAGRVIYTEYRGDEPSCSSCHALQDSTGTYPLTPAEENAFGVQFVNTDMIPLGEIGTDPRMALNFVTRTASTAQLAPFLPAPFTGAAELPAPVFLSILARFAVGTSLAAIDPPLTTPEFFEAIGFRVAAPGFPDYTPENLFAYRARPLDGIWASAPYLHNGSVQNLYELLLPAEERKESFNVGSQRFDPKRVGFRNSHGRNTSTLDTFDIGDSNSGHEYGTTLGKKERWALIEFMKTL
ncbi:MAG: hypothetical protein COB30_000950 [Ectothiorhodospiraceae bacterium]|nr:hypothetical protein [Ectothiorhodospiraceae bacterium]